MKVELHHKTVDEAREYLLDQIDIAIDNGEMVIEVIHGFNHGTKIREMVRGLSNKDHEYIIRVRGNMLNPGSSYIDLKKDVY